MPPLYREGMRLDPAEIGLLAVAVLFLIVLFCAVRSRRGTVRRVMALAARMGEEGLEL